MQYLTNALKVRRFMEAFGQEVKDKPEWPDDDTVNLRVDLIDEEFNELKQAVYEWGGNLEGVTDVLCDILYVTYGMAHSFGIDIDECLSFIINLQHLGAP